MFAGLLHVKVVGSRFMFVSMFHNTLFASIRFISESAKPYAMKLCYHFLIPNASVKEHHRSFPARIGS